MVKGFLLYLIALYLLGVAVEWMREDAEHEGFLKGWQAATATYPKPMITCGASHTDHHHSYRCILPRGHGDPLAPLT